MDRERMEYFKGKLFREKDRVNELLDLMKQNDTIDSRNEISSELSLYDNHPADISTEIYDIEKGMAFKNNEVNIINQIDDAIRRIHNGTYGTCKVCGENISEERLEFIPYAERCIDCQSKKYLIRDINDNPSEEDVIGKPFGLGLNEYRDDIAFDAEDSFQAVSRFNRITNTEEYYDDEESYTDPMDRISNEQYRNQLPD
ncbi:MAG: TraR/DksA C4-type zinc finger protein [Bacillota bacterium]|nr:TraR/DksA C4-type zinc finger protein [Bacillota bacterium]